MLYSIVGTDVDNSLEKRKAARPDHVERLQQLKNQGRLMICGPNPAVDAAEPTEAGFTGSVIIAEFESLEAAQSWADADPYIKQGVYANVSVKPFIKVLP